MANILPRPYSHDPTSGALVTNFENDNAYVHQDGDQRSTIQAHQLKNQESFSCVAPCLGTWKEIKIHESFDSDGISHHYDRLTRKFLSIYGGGWRGGCVAQDGNIYFTGSDEPYILVVDPTKSTCHAWGGGFGGNSLSIYSFGSVCTGLVSHPNGKLYSIPGKAAYAGIGEIDPLNKTYTSHVPDNKYEVRGFTISTTTNGANYSVASDVATTGGSGYGCTVNILEVDPNDNNGVKVDPNGPATIEIEKGGEGYAIGDVLNITGGDGNCQITVNINTEKQQGWQSWEGNYSGIEPGVFGGYRWEANSSYTVGDGTNGIEHHYMIVDNQGAGEPWTAYRITGSGTSGATKPTHTSGSATNGSVTLEHMGDGAPGGTGYMGSSIPWGELWVGGVVAPNNDCIYWIPRNHGRVMKVDPNNKKYNLIGTYAPTDLGKTGGTGNTEKGEWLGGSGKYSNGILGPDGMIYMIGWEYNGIGKIDPFTDTVTWEHKAFTATDLTGLDTITELQYSTPYPNITSQFFSSGVLGPDGKIYLVPKKYPFVGVYDPIDNSLTRLNDKPVCIMLNQNSANIYWEWNTNAGGANGLYKNYGTATQYADYQAAWTGGMHADNHTLSSGEAEYGSATLAANGKIYCAPGYRENTNSPVENNFAHFLEIDTTTSSWTRRHLKPYVMPAFSEMMIVSSGTLEASHGKENIFDIAGDEVTLYAQGDTANGSVTLDFNMWITGGISMYSPGFITNVKINNEAEVQIAADSWTDIGFRGEMTSITIRGEGGNKPRLGGIKINDDKGFDIEDAPSATNGFNAGPGFYQLCDKKLIPINNLGRTTVLAPNGKIYSAPGALNRVGYDLACGPTGIVEYHPPGSTQQPAEWLYGPYTSNT